MKWLFPFALCLSLLLALLIRAPDLAQRPFHNDEAVNAVKTCELFESGRYRYDPSEYHGPLLHYATVGFLHLAGVSSTDNLSEASFRWVPLLSGLGLIPLLWFVRDGLGRVGAGWAACLTAFSPAMVFYSRDYIHETLLVVCTFAFMVSVWRYVQSRHWTGAVGMGLAAGLMYATKETFVLNLFALGGAGGWVWLRHRPFSAPPRAGLRRVGGHGLLAIAVGSGVALLFFSSFGQNPSGPMDSVRTYFPWLTRAAGETDHVHPWFFYLKRLLWWRSEGGWPWTELGFLAFAGVAFTAALRRRTWDAVSARFIEWVGVYTGILLVLYSMIPYKTPWCVLGVAHGVVLLAGAGVAVTWKWIPTGWERVTRMGVLSVVVAQAGWQAWSLSHRYPTEQTNPWAYAETSPDVRQLVERLEGLAGVAPEGHAVPIQVVVEDNDYWPLPFYLRTYTQVGWWSGQSPPLAAPVLVLSPTAAQAMDEREEYLSTGIFQLRRGVFRSCFVKRDLWEAYLLR